MQTFYEWLNESVSLVINGYENSQIKNMDDLSYKLSRFLENEPRIGKINPIKEQQVGIVSPDGQNEKTLNFYNWGFKNPEQVLSKIKGFLDKNKIKYSTPKQGQSKMFEVPVYRIPILQIPKHSGPPDINMNNRNAEIILKDILGFEPESNGVYEISARDLLIKINDIDEDLFGIHAIEPHSVKYKNGPEMIHGGLSREDIKKRLDIISNLAKFAVDNGYDTIIGV